MAALGRIGGHRRADRGGHPRAELADLLPHARRPRRRHPPGRQDHRRHGQARRPGVLHQPQRGETSARPTPTGSVRLPNIQLARQADPVGHARRHQRVRGRAARPAGPRLAGCGSCEIDFSTSVNSYLQGLHYHLLYDLADLGRLAQAVRAQGQPGLPAAMRARNRWPRPRPAVTGPRARSTARAPHPCSLRLRPGIGPGNLESPLQRPFSRRRQDLYRRRRLRPVPHGWHRWMPAWPGSEGVPSCSSPTWGASCAGGCARPA